MTADAAHVAAVAEAMLTEWARVEPDHAITKFRDPNTLAPHDRLPDPITDDDPDLPYGWSGP